MAEIRARLPTGEMLVVERFGGRGATVRRLKEALGDTLGYHADAVRALRLAFQGAVLDDEDATLEEALDWDMSPAAKSPRGVVVMFFESLPGSAGPGAAWPTSRRGRVPPSREEAARFRNRRVHDWDAMRDKVDPEDLEEEFDAKSSSDGGSEDPGPQRKVLHMHRSDDCKTLVIRCQTDEPEFWAKLVREIDPDVFHFSPYLNMLELPGAEWDRSTADQIASFARSERFHVLRFDRDDQAHERGVQEPECGQRFAGQVNGETFHGSGCDVFSAISDGGAKLFNDHTGSLHQRQLKPARSGRTVSLIIMSGVLLLLAIVLQVLLQLIRAPRGDPVFP